MGQVIVLTELKAQDVLLELLRPNTATGMYTRKRLQPYARKAWKLTIMRKFSEPTLKWSPGNLEPSSEDF